MHNQLIKAYWSKHQQDGIGWRHEFLKNIVDLDLFNQPTVF